MRGISIPVRRALVPLLAILLLTGLSACGSDDEQTTAAATTATTTGTGDAGDTGGDSGDGGEATVETVDPPAKVPDDWTTSINRAAGFSIGVPPGWKARSTPGAQGSILTSPDKLIAMTVTADRTSGALELPLDEFATRTAEALGSDVVGKDRFDNLFVTDPAPFKDTYEASAVRASGKSERTGVKELIFVVVLRRPGMASYVVISRENAEEQSDVSTRDEVKEIIRSLRGRPPA